MLCGKKYEILYILIITMNGYDKTNILFRATEWLTN
jgi:hypothetical protein